MDNSQEISTNKCDNGLKMIQLVEGALKNHPSLLQFYRTFQPTYILTPIFNSSAKRFHLHYKTNSDKKSTSYNVVDISASMDEEAVLEIFRMCTKVYSAEQQKLTDQARQRTDS
ncbi:MAG: hypothetical protein FWE64_00480 [Alphaproteobacteria bacterium]|nr:hypothetical protein [Alphaproteobacteria bacterium]